jgi:Tol biopolymer transport system component
MNRSKTTASLLVVLVTVASCSSDSLETSATSEPATIEPTTTPVAPADAASTAAPPTTATSEPATIAPTTTPVEPTVAASTAAPPTTAIAVGPGEEWIAYTRDAGIRTEVYLVRADGTGAHAVAHDLAGLNQTNPDWSPDGSRLVFAATGDDAQDDLWIVDASGGTPTKLLDCVDECVWFDDPAWSPDGSKVVYARIAKVDGAGVGTLETVDVTTGTVDVLATGTGNDFYAGPRWSPDGQSIVAEVGHRSDPSVFADVVGVTLSVFDLGAPELVARPLTDPALFAATADWSPDGSTIVFAALPTADATDSDLFTIRPDGSGMTRLTQLADAGRRAEHPTFSTDGTEIVFVGPLAPGDDGQFLTVPTAGGEVTAATGEPVVNGYHPRFRPASGG